MLGWLTRASSDPEGGSFAERSRVWHTFCSLLDAYDMTNHNGYGHRRFLPGPYEQRSHAARIPLGKDESHDRSAAIQRRTPHP